MDHIDELTQSCFNALIALRRVDEATTTPVERLQREIKRHVDRMIEQASRHNVAPKDAQEMAYAVVALADELALNGPSEVSQYWMNHMLQMAYFNENLAGERFFDHMNTAKAANNYDVLRVYYLCLLFGFKGKHGVRDGEVDLGDIITSVRYALAKGGFDEPDALSPRAERPREAMATAEKNYKLFWLPIGGVGLAVILYIWLSASIAGMAKDLTLYLGKLYH